MLYKFLHINWNLLVFPFYKSAQKTVRTTWYARFYNPILIKIFETKIHQFFKLSQNTIGMVYWKIKYLISSFNYTFHMNLRESHVLLYAQYKDLCRYLKKLYGNSWQWFEIFIKINNNIKTLIYEMVGSKFWLRNRESLIFGNFG